MMMMVVMLGHCLYGSQGKLTVSSYLTISYIHVYMHIYIERERDGVMVTSLCKKNCVVFQVFGCRY